MFKSDAFNLVLSQDELTAWNATKDVVENFLGKHRSQNYPVLVTNMLNAFSKINVNVSLKIHFMHHHLDYFGNQLASESDEHGERFHQIAMPMEIRYRGKKLDALLADICWWSHKMSDPDDENGENDDDISDIDMENINEDDAEEYAYYSNDSSDSEIESEIDDDELTAPPGAYFTNATTTIYKIVNCHDLSCD